MSDAQIIETLKSFKDILEVSSIWSSAFRTVMWWINTGLSKLVDLLSDSLSEIYSLINFFDSKYVNDFIDKYVVVIFALASLSLAFLGWKIIIKKQSEYDKIITNSLIAITLFIVLPWGMQQGQKLVTASVSVLDSGISKSTKIFSTNITDLYVIDKKSWKSSEPNPKNYIKDEVSLSFLNISETMDTGGIFSSTEISDNGTKILKHKLNDASGELKLEELKSSFIGQDEAYYRYSWHPFFICIELGTIALVLFFTSFKTAQLIQELGILKIIAQGTVFTDIESGQRNKKLIEKIRNTFIILYIIMLLLNIYLLFIDFITASKISKPTQLVMIFASGILVIDGPNFIEELFGIDAGLKSIGRSIMATVAGAKGMKDLASGIWKGASAVGKASLGTAEAIGKTAIHTSAGLKGALDGFKEGSNQGAGNNSKDSNSNVSPLAGMSNGNASQEDRDTPLGDICNNNESQGDMGTTGDTAVGSMSSGSASQDTGSTPLGGMSNGSESQGVTGSTPLEGMSSGSASQDTGSTPLGGMSNGSESQGVTGSTPLEGMSNGSASQGVTGSTLLGGSSGGSTPLSSKSGTTTSKGSIGANTPLASSSGSSISKGGIGTTAPLASSSGSSISKGGIGTTAPLASSSGSSISKGNIGTTAPLASSSVASISKGGIGTTAPLASSSGSSISKGNIGTTAPLASSSVASISKGGIGTTAPLANTSGSSISKGGIGTTAPLASSSGSSISKGNIGTTAPLANTSGSSISKGGIGTTAPLASSSGSSISKGNIGTTAPLANTSGSSISKGGIGTTAPLASSLRANTSKIYKPNTIKLPKGVEIKPIEKPTTKTIADVEVSKYASMAEKIYNSPTLKSARNTYQVSKNSAMALKKERNDNEKRD